MTRITTHVLYTTTGRPAVGMTVHLEELDGMSASPLAAARTDAEGRVREWPREGREGRDGRDWEGVPAGRYRLVFETGEWFKSSGLDTLYPEVVVHFEVRGEEPHYHVPLLISPYGYSTYRGT
ncbi:MAG TPA: hydroxyisourate hydrolase [Gemmatimonadales bacterium]